MGDGKDKGNIMYKNPDATEGSGGWKPSVDVPQRLILKGNLSPSLPSRNDKASSLKDFSLSVLATFFHLT